MSTPPAPVLPPTAAPHITPPRPFNTVTYHRGTITKASTHPSLAAELHFYRNVPPQIAHLFPALLSHLQQIHDCYYFTSITTPHIPGLTVSSIFVAHALHPTLLRAILDDLLFMHDVITHHRVEDHLIYHNYANKLSLRFENNQNLYHHHNVFEQHIHALSNHLAEYQRHNHARISHVVHGDPVFTNIIVSETPEQPDIQRPRLCFIDMRGSLGDTHTLCGDAVYDLAKVFQSLCGYDFVLTDTPVSPADIEYMRALQHAFVSHVSKIYRGVKLRDLVLITCSHFLSLLPLHNNPQHTQKFARMAFALLSWVEAQAAGVLEEIDFMNLIADVLVDHSIQPHQPPPQ